MIAIEEIFISKKRISFTTTFVDFDCWSLLLDPSCWATNWLNATSQLSRSQFFLLLRLLSPREAHIQQLVSFLCLTSWNEEEEVKPLVRGKRKSVHLKESGKNDFLVPPLIPHPGSPYPHIHQIPASIILLTGMNRQNVDWTWECENKWSEAGKKCSWKGTSSSETTTKREEGGFWEKKKKQEA